LAFVNRVSFLQLDAQHPARNWGGDDKPIVSARFTILVNGNAHGTVSGFRAFDENRRRAQHDPHKRSATQRDGG
jgi:hypothetical protein